LPPDWRHCEGRYFRHAPRRHRGYQPMTTVDQTTHFMRAATRSDVLADARVVRLGRTMSSGRVTLSSATNSKPVAMVSSAFAML
jgi:acyl-coenzyme A thioesterase PaaI-like protein